MLLFIQLGDSVVKDSMQMCSQQQHVGEEERNNSGADDL